MAEAGRDPRLGDLEARVVEFASRRAMDRPVDATATKHHLVRGVDDRVHRQLRDGLLLDSHRHNLTTYCSDEAAKMKSATSAAKATRTPMKPCEVG